MIRTMIDHNSPLGRLRQRQRVSSRDAAQKSSRTTKRRWRLSSEEERILRHVMTEEMDYIDSEEFRKPDAEQRIYDQAPAVQKPDVSWYRPLMDDPTPARNQSTKKTSTLLLTAAEERVLFLQYNYARHRIAELQREIGSTEPTEEQAKEILRWYRVAQSYLEQIAETNLALVLAMAKRTRMSEVDFADLVSEGNMALLRAIDKFDVTRGFKFSTYACRAILKAFSRNGMKLTKYRQMFPTDFDPNMERSTHVEDKRQGHEDDCVDELRDIIRSNRAELTDIEQEVIEHRFAIGKPQDEARPMTLEEVGRIIGVTKERVRQIQNKALDKIRHTMEDGFLS